MGVTTQITLSQAQALFQEFPLSSLTPTEDGVMDTTYILKEYILKYFERDVSKKISQEHLLLKKLHQAGLRVPLPLANAEGWYLYTRLQGSQPKTTKSYHIQALARFLAKMHTVTSKETQMYSRVFLEEYAFDKLLKETKRSYFAYYKKLETLQEFTMQKDGFIHGDIFKDNTLFHGQKLAVIDFIDGGLGSFTLDIAVALVAFNPHQRRSYTQLFLQTYNQNAPQKVSLQALQTEIKIAAKIYALLRIHKYKNPQKAKLLANLW